LSQRASRSRPARRALSFPTSWSGRLWARTWCAKDATGRFTCATGNCRTGTLEGSGPDDATPATLAEFTLDGGGHNDLYDMSLWWTGTACPSWWSLRRAAARPA
jgi:hypothetical protein